MFVFKCIIRPVTLNINKKIREHFGLVILKAKAYFMSENE